MDLYSTCGTEHTFDHIVCLKEANICHKTNLQNFVIFCYRKKSEARHKMLKQLWRDESSKYKFVWLFKSTCVYWKHLLWRKLSDVIHFDHQRLGTTVPVAQLATHRVDNVKDSGSNLLRELFSKDFFCNFIINHIIISHVFTCMFNKGHQGMQWWQKAWFTILIFWHLSFFIYMVNMGALLATPLIVLKKGSLMFSCILQLRICHLNQMRRSLWMGDIWDPWKKAFRYFDRRYIYWLDNTRTTCAKRLTWLSKVDHRNNFHSR